MKCVKTLTILTCYPTCHTNIATSTEHQCEMLLIKIYCIVHNTVNNIKRNINSYDESWKTINILVLILIRVKIPDLHISIFSILNAIVDLWKNVLYAVKYTRPRRSIPIHHHIIQYIKPENNILYQWVQKSEQMSKQELTRAGLTHYLSNNTKIPKYSLNKQKKWY